MLLHRIRRFAPIFTVLLAALVGCVDDPDLDPAALDVPDDAELGSTAQGVISGWTPYTSEEYPPITCDGSSLVNGVQVTGPYGDNIRLLCQPTNLIKGDSYWTPYFSEEHRGMTYCAISYWMTGLTCRGRYCDEVSIQCSKISDTFIKRIRGTWGISEEDPKYLFFPGEYAVGAYCMGPYCDDLHFGVASMRIENRDRTDTISK